MYNVPVMKKRRRVAVTRIFLLVLAVAGLLFYVIPGRVSADTKADPGHFSVKATFAQDIEVRYNTVSELNLVDEYDFGLPSISFRNLQVIVGAYSSGTYGSYDLRVNRLTKKYIVLKSEDRYLIFNCNGENETVECYNAIRSKLNELIIQG